jgi:aminoglycoside phosphotransferase (APT) family kinase protein
MGSRVNQGATQVKFCATGKSGLGHLRRIVNVAAALRQRAPGQDMALLTNASPAGLADAELALFNQLITAPRDAMAGVLAGMAPGPVVVDTAAIEQIGLLPDPLCLILRETVSDKLTAFRLFNGRPWDQIIVPAPADHWTPRDSIGARDIRNVGWIYRVAAASDSTLLPSRAGLPRILIATGGGGTRETALALKAEIDGILAAFKASRVIAAVVQVAGPRLDADGRLDLADDFIDVGARLNEAFAEADVVITTVGYNSVLELAGLTTPTMMIPIPRTYDDQTARAEHWGPRLGLAHRAGDIERSAQWLVEVVASHQRRPPVDLGPSGDAAAADLILKLCAIGDERESSDWLFRKLLSSQTRPHAKSVATRANLLFRAGVPTPPARAADSDDHGIEMVVVEGDTLRQRWRNLGAPFVTAQDAAEAMVATPGWLSPLVAMHRMPIGADFDAPALAAMAKVETRLKRDVLARAGVLDAEYGELERLAATIAQAIATEQCRGDQSPVLVHGDFHAGQILLPADGGHPWVIDLDDLAIGPLEFDLANVAAHFVTSSGLYTGAVGPGFALLADAVGRAYVAAGGATPDPAGIRVYGAASLLRRCLKLASARRQWPSTKEIAGAANDLLRAPAAKPVLITRLAAHAQVQRLHSIPG